MPIVLECRVRGIPHALKICSVGKCLSFSNAVREEFHTRCLPARPSEPAPRPEASLKTPASPVNGISAGVGYVAQDVKRFYTVTAVLLPMFCVQKNCITTIRHIENTFSDSVVKTTPFCLLLLSKLHFNKLQPLLADKEVAILKPVSLLLGIRISSQG
ncbi:hypothetical protein NDU88_006230 [Pleurodeles waltl]|uniref:Uncharacterized protein n=1 Tax=Pleurodeles waltl TaxID=8319 RepID=A0AAV7WBW9_PLEWA|nr:hypothetical protein NDU88_006230 [Pleurodeles waltl]